MRKSTRLLAMLLAVLMAVSVLPVSAFAAENVITAVDTSSLVMETTFPYSADITSDQRWSSNTINVVENPVFYETVPATVDGADVDLAVTWVSEDYAYDTFGTYTFTAVAEGYTWECEAPVITVNVIDGCYANGDGYFALVSAAGESVDFVIKPSGLEDKPTQIYDATGCNKLFLNSSGAEGITNAGRFGAGIKNDSTGTNRGDIYTVAGEGTNKITAKDGVQFTVMTAGNGNLRHYGDTYIYADSVDADGTENAGLYGGGYVFTNDKNADVYGDAYIDVTGASKLNKIRGGGWCHQVTGSANLYGTAYVNIHDLADGWYIGDIACGPKNMTSDAMVLTVDDAAVLDSVTDWTNITPIVNGVEWTKITAEDFVGELAAIPETLAVGAECTLPATLGGYDVTWSSTVDTSKVNRTTYTVTSIALPEEGYVYAEEIAVTITVENEITADSIVSVEVPQNETWTYASWGGKTGSLNMTYDFWDTLTVKTAGGETKTLDGFNWVPDEDVVFGKGESGDYIYRIDAANSTYGSLLTADALESATVTLHVDGNTNNTTGISTNYCLVGKPMIIKWNGTKNEWYESTGLNKTYSSSFSTALAPVLGASSKFYTGSSVTPVEGMELTLESGATVAGIYGTSEIPVNGDMTVNLKSGSVVNGPITAGSCNSDAAVNGTVTLNIEDGATVAGAITRGTATNLVVNLESTEYVTNVTFDENTKVYVNGIEWSEETTSDTIIEIVVPQSETWTFATVGNATTSLTQEYNFWDTLTVKTAGGETKTLDGFTWVADEAPVFGAGESGDYVYRIDKINSTYGDLISSTAHENATVTLHVKGNLGNGLKPYTAFYFVEGMSFIVRATTADDTTTVNYWDVTGCNHPRLTGWSSNLKVTLGAGTRYFTEESLTPVEDMMVTVESGTTVSGIYGTIDVPVVGDLAATVESGAAITGDIVAGAADAESGATITGTVTINIEDGASVTGTISRGTADKLVVNLYGASASLIGNVTFDDNTEVYVDGVRKIKVSADAEEITAIPATVNNYAYFSLPTTIGGVDGFTWDGGFDITSAGTYTVTLVAPETVYMSETVSLTIEVLETPNVISAIYTDGVVLETVFPYSGDSTNDDTTNPDRWSRNTYMEVTEPTFYKTLSAKVDDVVVDLPLTWTSEDYVSNVPGTYTFTASAEGYVWDCDAPTITVVVLDGCYANASGLFGLVSAQGDAIDVVVKRDAFTSAGSTTNQIYDATGCNKLFRSSAEVAAEDCNVSTGVRFVAGIKNGTTGLAGENLTNVYKSTTYGDNKITISDNANVTLVAGGNLNIPHEGHTYVTVKDASVYMTNAAGEVKSDALLAGGVYGGGCVNLDDKDATVKGNAYINISGNVGWIDIVSGGGVIYNGNNNTADLKGTAYVTIHDLADTSEIGIIERGSADDLVVYLDDTSASLVDVVVFDANTTVYINGEEYAVPTADYSVVETALAKVPADLTGYTTASAQAVTDAVNAVVYDLPEYEQATVDAYAAAIENAVVKLTTKAAYTLVDGVLTISGNAVMDDYASAADVPWGEDVTRVVIEEGVTSIGDRAFWKCTNLETVEIASTVTSIGYGAFYNTAVTEVVLPANLETIGDYAFSNCKSLTGITIPASVTTVGYAAFYDCTAMETLTIEEGLTVIGKSAFSGCSALTSVNIPDSVTEIGQGAFMRCSALTEVTIGAGVTAIDTSAFNRCPSLAAFVVSADNTAYVAEDGVLYTADMATLVRYPEGKAGTVFAVPDSVTAILKGAFVNCAALEEITIGASVASIDAGSFRDNTALAVINVADGNTAYVAEDGVLYTADMATLVRYPIAKGATATVPTTVTAIAENAFAGTAVTKVVYGGSNAQWKAITVADGNDALASATVYCMVEDADAVTEISADMVDFELRCTTAVEDGKLYVTYDTEAETKAANMKLRLGNIPEGATLSFADGETSVAFMDDNGIICISNTWFGILEVPMLIEYADGSQIEFVLVADFGNTASPVRYITRGEVSYADDTVVITSASVYSNTYFAVRTSGNETVTVENVTDGATVVQPGATVFRVFKSAYPVEFDLVYSENGVTTRTVHVVVTF